MLLRRLWIGVAGGLITLGTALDLAPRAVATARLSNGTSAASPVPSSQQGLHVVPFPGTPDAAPASQVIFSSLSRPQLRAVRVTGTRSGAHAGRLVALPEGAGTAFVAVRGFTPGERVLVCAHLSSPAAGRAAGVPGARWLRFSFGVAVARPMHSPVVASASGDRARAGRFRSAPGLHPPPVHVTPDPDTTSGDIFITPEHSRQTGPMILNARGQLLWFQPVNAPGTLDAFNLQVQHYQGRPVLTWWRGNLAGQPSEDVVMDRAYRTVAVVRAANGYATDEHEFQITPSGAAYITSFHPVQANLSSLGGPSNGTVLDYAIQEIDVRTGRLLWEWDALAHIPLSDSYVRPHGSTWFDYFHANSIQQLPDGNVLVSARNTWGVYKISHATGRVIWTMGGKHSNFRIQRRARFSWQHDAHLDQGTLSLFDDASGGSGRHTEPQSSAKLLKVDQRRMTVSLRARYTHSPPLLTGLEGSVQRLPNHNIFVGWGGAPDFSEYTPSGHQLFNGSLALGQDSYRAFRFIWHARPLTRPSLVLSPRTGGAVELYASWNGATGVAAWRVRGGSRRGHLRPLAVVPWAGFETAVRVDSEPRYLDVEALGSRGRVLRTSWTRAVPSHLSVFGGRAFVSSSSGAGAVPVGCFTGRSCRIRVQVRSRGSAIGHAAPTKVFSRRGGLVWFRLSSAGLRELKRKAGHPLSVVVRVRDSSGAGLTAPLALIPFSTTGSAPPRRFHQTPVLQVLGGRQFVAPSGHGGILAACYAPTPCQVTASVSTQGTPIATAAPQKLGVDEVGYVPFKLTGAGQAMLSGAPGNQLAANVSLTSHGATATAQIALVRYQ